LDLSSEELVFQAFALRMQVVPLHRGVVSAAAGTAPGGSLFRAIAVAASEFVTKPKVGGAVQLLNAVDSSRARSAPAPLVVALQVEFETGFFT
jgi:hypothetical protein